MIKAVFFDVGNTLVSKNHGYGLTPKLKRDLLDLKRAGISIGVMSIRTLKLAKEALPGIEFDFYICLDGSLVYEGNKKVLDLPLKETPSTWLAYYTEDGVLAKDEETRKNLARRGFLTTGVSSSLACPYGFVTEEDILIRGLRKVHWEKSKLNTYFAEGSSKGKAIEALAKRHGWKRSEILSFGDGPNDIDAARSAGKFVAMSGCPLSLGSEATFQTGFAYEEGVSNALRLLSLLPLNYLLFREGSSEEVGGVETHAKYLSQYWGKKGNLFCIKHKEGKNIVDYENDGEKHSYEELPGLLEDRPVIIFFNSGHWIEEMGHIRKAFPKAAFFYRTGGNEIPSAPLKDMSVPFKERQSYWVSALNANIDHLISNSHFTDRRLLELGISPSLLYRISGGVPLERIETLRKRKAELRKTLFPKEGIHLLCASRFVPYKRMGLLLKSFSLLSDDYDLTLIGDGPDYQELYERYQGNPRIRFLGKLPHEEVLPYIVGADIYLQCSGNLVYEVPDGNYIHCEGMGRTILEAICSSTYVVATSSGAFSEFIKGRRGVLVKDDPISIAQAIEEAPRKSLKKDPHASSYGFARVFSLYDDLAKPKKRNALVSSKFLGVPDGGGSSMVDTLTHVLSPFSELDFFCLRTPKETAMEDKGIHAYCYLPNPNRGAAKFSSRLTSIPYYSKKLNPLLKEYPEIVVVHASKAFSLSEANLSRVILFPMFLSKDYLRSNEYPPREYFEEEKRVLQKARLIVSPSKTDKEEIVSMYGVDPNKIVVIPRGIDPVFEAESKGKKNVLDSLSLLVSANIKEQKNLKEALLIAKKANEKGIKTTLRICGKADEEASYAWLKEQERKFPWLIYEGALKKEELSKRMKESDLLLCSSFFETFGRCVYEAASSSLPSLISSRLDCFKGVFDAKSSYFYKSEEDAVSFLARFCSSPSLRLSMARESKKRSLPFSKEAEELALKKIFFPKEGLFVLGTRPEAIKMTPVMKELQDKGIKVTAYDTYQHDGLASKILREKGIESETRDCLGEGSFVSRAIRFTKTLEKERKRFSFVCVQGDTLSALAGAYYALFTNTPLFYLESGMRSFDESSPYPEEKIRKEISRIASLNFAPSAKEAANLKKEGARRIHLTGNTFQDALLEVKLEVNETNVVLVTLHRRENLPYLKRIFLQLKEICLAHPSLSFLFPLHPNPKIEKEALPLRGVTNLRIASPLPPEAFRKELYSCKMVLTDSGGVEEEARYLGKRCLVIRKATERSEQNLVNPASLEFKGRFDALLLGEAPSKDFRYGKESGAKGIASLIEKELYGKN